MRNLPILILAILALTSCVVSKQTSIRTHYWTDVAVIDELEVFVDTANIDCKDGFCYTFVKTIYPTGNSKFNYIDKIKKTYTLKETHLEKKMKQWDNFSYNISLRVYDCSNKQYKILEVIDYTSDGKTIVSTRTPISKSTWLDIGKDSMGDYLIYYVCDYGN